MRKEKAAKYKAPCMGSIVASIKSLEKMEAGLTLEHCRKCKDFGEENCCSLLNDAIKAYDTVFEAMFGVLVSIDEDMAFDLVNEEKPHL